MPWLACVPVVFLFLMYCWFGYVWLPENNKNTESIIIMLIVSNISLSFALLFLHSALLFITVFVSLLFLLEEERLSVHDVWLE